LSIASRLPNVAKSEGTQTWLGPAASICAEMRSLMADMESLLLSELYIQTSDRRQGERHGLSEGCNQTSDITAHARPEVTADRGPSQEAVSASRSPERRR
jgi:hypothetical protein